MGLFSTLGKIAGTVIGGYFGGPAGAKAGAQIGGTAGGMLDKDDKSTEASSGGGGSVAAGANIGLMSPIGVSDLEDETKVAQTYQGSNPWTLQDRVASWYPDEVRGR